MLVIVIEHFARRRQVDHEQEHEHEHDCVFAAKSVARRID
jgi:hypothetical protein